MKAWFGLLQDVKVVDLNRLLKLHGVRLVVKKSKDWGKNVSVTAHAAGAPAKRGRAPRQTVIHSRTEPGQIGPVGAEETITVISMADDGPGGPLG